MSRLHFFIDTESDLCKKFNAIKDSEKSKLGVSSLSNIQTLEILVNKYK